MEDSSRPIRMTGETKEPRDKEPGDGRNVTVHSRVTNWDLRRPPDYPPA